MTKLCYLEVVKVMRQKNGVAVPRLWPKPQVTFLTFLHSWKIRKGDIKDILVIRYFKLNFQRYKKRKRIEDSCYYSVVVLICKSNKQTNIILRAFVKSKNTSLILIFCLLDNVWLKIYIFFLEGNELYPY